MSLDGTDVTVSWESPTAHYSTIDEYEILFKHADGTYNEYLASCDGKDAGVVAGRSCQIPMLLVQPFLGLEVGDLIVVKVRAHNTDGWGEYSEPNVEGQLLECLPLQIGPL